MSEELIENGIIPDDQIPSVDENSPSSTPEDTDKLEKLERKIDENSTSISKLNSLASALSDKSFLSKIEISEPEVDTSSMGSQEKKEVYNTHILSYLTSLADDGLYTFINNSNGSLENFLVYDFNPTNEHKGIEGLVLKDGNDIYIYYINEVTYKLKITENYPEEGQYYYEWSKKDNLYSVTKTEEDGHILVKDPLSRGSVISQYTFNDLMKNDVIRGVIEIVENDLQSIVEGYMLPFLEKCLKNETKLIIPILRDLKLLRELINKADISPEELDKKESLIARYGEEPYSENNIKEALGENNIPCFNPDSCLVKVGDSYEFNPLNISTNMEGSDKPLLSNGLYIFRNNTTRPLVENEGSNNYETQYGFCSMAGSSRTPGSYSQYIYYINLVTYWRIRGGSGGSMWLNWNKTNDIKIEPIIWNSNSNLNDYQNNGIFICKNANRTLNFGQTRPSDNLPMNEVADIDNNIYANFSFILNVSNSILTDNNGNTLSVIGQTLQLTNGVTGKTKLYNRTCKNNTWSQWSESNNVIDLGQVMDEDLKQCTQEGSYKGIINAHEYGSVLRNVSEFLNYIYFLGSSAKSDGGALALPPCSIFDLDVKNNKSINEASNGVIPNIVTQTAKVQLANGVYVEVCRICKDVNKGNWTNWYGVSYSMTLMDDVELMSE